MRCSPASPSIRIPPGAHDLAGVAFPALRRFFNGLRLPPGLNGQRSVFRYKMEPLPHIVHLIVGRPDPWPPSISSSCHCEGRRPAAIRIPRPLLPECGIFTHPRSGGNRPAAGGSRRVPSMERRSNYGVRAVPTRTWRDPRESNPQAAPQTSPARRGRIRGMLPIFRSAPYNPGSRTGLPGAVFPAVKRRT